MMFSPNPVAQQVPAETGYVSKGSMAAFITHVKALDDVAPTSAEYATLVNRIRELKPALCALGLFDVMQVRDPRIAAILELEREP